MYSPISQPALSPFTSLRTSQTHLSTCTHSRTNSNAKPPSVASHPHEPHRVPSHKKLSLTFQAQQFRSQQPSQQEENQGKRQVLPVVEVKSKPISLQGAHNEQSVAGGGQQQLMIYFQQHLENLKQKYLHSLRDYEGRIDELQQMLLRNNLELQQKNAQVSKLEAALREAKLREKQKDGQIDGQLQIKVEDLQKRLAIIAEFMQETRLETQQASDRLTDGVIKCFGSRLATLRDQQARFIGAALQKLAGVETRLEVREKQEQSVGTRGSMESVEEPPIASADQGISFWDDCFFYPGEHSENCNLLTEMYTRRSEPLNLWVDQEGFLRYCDSGSFLFNRKGERVVVAYDELEWLREQGMVRIY